MIYGYFFCKTYFGPLLCHDKLQDLFHHRFSYFKFSFWFIDNDKWQRTICYEWGMFILFWAKNEIAIKETFLYIMTLAIIYWKMAVIFKVAFVIYASLFAETLQWPLTCPFRTYIYQYLPLLTLWLSSFRKYVL